MLRVWGFFPPLTTEETLGLILLYYNVKLLLRLYLC